MTDLRALSEMVGSGMGSPSTILVDRMNGVSFVSAPARVSP